MMTEESRSISSTEEPFSARLLASVTRAWGCALIFQVVATRWWTLLLSGEAGTPLLAIGECAVLLWGIVLVCKPTRITLLGYSALFYLAHFLVQLPDVPNHRVLSAFLALTFLLILKPFRSAPETRLPELYHTARLLMAGTYFLATLHKINSDFLFLPQSCGVQYAAETFAWLHLPIPPSVVALVPLATVLLEGALCILLLTPWVGGRRNAVGVAALFHLALTWHPLKFFANFSAIVYLGLLLCLGGRGAVTSEIPRLMGMIAAGVLAALMLLQLFGGPVLGAASIIFLVPFLFAIFALWWCRASGVLLPAIATINERSSWVGAILVGLFLFNGFTPYLGLKNRTAFDMYANMRLESDVSNHLLFSRAFDPFGELQYRVEIISSEIPELQEAEQNNLSVARLQLDALSRQNPSAVTVYRWRGGEYQISGEQLSPDGYSASWIRRKLTIFRNIPAEASAAVPCTR